MMIRKLKQSCVVLALAALPLLPGANAVAGPLDEAKARAHLDAVAAGDLEALMKDYADDAYMEWVGGPLDGRYRGKEAIRVVWQKFIAVNDGKPRPASFGKLSAFANAKGASVQQRTQGHRKLPLKVLHVLTYREGDLTTELWQIAPAMQLDQ
jgi:ketosteroid isomerase-like protein